MKVLVVEDSKSMVKILTNQLNTMGISDILYAGNGEEGLLKLSSHMPVDVVLLDINMPEMDGMTMLRMMRSKAAYDSVQVIMVTSESEKSKVLDAIRYGAKHYILKPFTAEKLKEKLDAISGNLNS